LIAGWSCRGAFGHGRRTKGFGVATRRGLAAPLAARQSFCTIAMRILPTGRPRGPRPSGHGAATARAAAVASPLPADAWRASCQRCLIAKSASRIGRSSGRLRSKPSAARPGSAHVKHPRQHPSIALPGIRIGDVDGQRARRTEPPPFVCESGDPNWASRWPFEKQEWCCRHEGRGCRDPFDCFDGAVVAWPRLKVQWCCKHTSLGCMALDRKFEQQPLNLQRGDSSAATWSGRGRRRLLAIAAFVSTGFGAAAYATLVGFRSQAVTLAAAASGEYSPVPAVPP